MWLSEQTVPFASYIIKRLDFITEVESVHCAVRTESMYNTDLKVNRTRTGPFCYKWSTVLV